MNENLMKNKAALGLNFGWSNRNGRVLLTSVLEVPIGMEEDMGFYCYIGSRK